MYWMESVVLEAIPVQMSLELLDGKINIKINAFTTDCVTWNIRALDLRPLANKWKHLRSIPFLNVGPKPIIEILIGICYTDPYYISII